MGVGNSYHYHPSLISTEREVSYIPQDKSPEITSAHSHHPITWLSPKKDWLITLMKLEKDAEPKEPGPTVSILYPCGNAVSTAQRKEQSISLSGSSPAPQMVFPIVQLIFRSLMCFCIFFNVFRTQRQKGVELVLPQSPVFAFICVKNWKSHSHVQLFAVPWTVSNPPNSSVHRILQARILQCIAIPFSRGSSQPRDRTQVSCIAGRFFTNWATKETPYMYEIGQQLN